MLPWTLNPGKNQLGLLSKVILERMVSDIEGNQT